MSTSAKTGVKHLTVSIPEDMAGMRLDQALASLFPDFSRARLQQWIRDGQVTVTGRQLRPKDKVQGGEEVTLIATVENDETHQAEAIPLDIVYEDPSILVINKPAGLVVHPAAGNREGTMLNALLHHAPELAGVPRAGIVHRLDKDTSGLMVVARTLAAQKRLVEQIQARAFLREYQAVVCGVMTAGGTIDAPIDRHPRARTKMAVVEKGKQAVTRYRVIERFRQHTHIRITLETGRTHQIRVHMAHIHYPLVGDPVYGGRLRIPKESNEELITVLKDFKRQALHASKLGLTHPDNNEQMSWHASLPDDMARLIEVLKDDARKHKGD